VFGLIAAGLLELHAGCVVGFDTACALATAEVAEAAGSAVGTTGTVTLAVSPTGRLFGKAKILCRRARAAALLRRKRER